MSSLAYQLRKITYHIPFDHEALVEKGEWKDAAEMVAIVEQQKHKAIKLLQVKHSPGTALPVCCC